jgi:very-short-patch-repair endonuclease
MAFGRRARPDLEKWDFNYTHITYAEEAFEHHIASLGQVYRFNHRIWTYIVDFYLPTYRLVVELDGTSHDGDKAKEADLKRDTWLGKQGLAVLRYTNEQSLTAPLEVLADIRTHMAARGYERNWFKGTLRGAPKSGG